MRDPADIVDEAMEETPRVSGLAGLLDAVQGFARRFVAFRSHHQSVACALWTAHTHALDAFDVTGYLAITSPEKRSGKTRLQDVLELLTPRPWRAVTPSEAVTFRKIAADAPTLLLDEVDAIFRDRSGTYEGLRALLNAGYRRGVKVPRCVGEGKNIKVAEFEVFCPKAIAGIGELPETVADRSIPIRLQRRSPREKVEAFRFRDVAPQATQLRDALAAWAAANLEALRDARPELPAALNDRAAECWEPLLAIADAAGGEWPSRARAAALALHQGQEDESWGVRLLANIRTVFGDADRQSSADLAEALSAEEEWPWGDLRGRPLDARGLARRLKEFDVHPRKVRLGAGTFQGYLAADFEDAWSRYLASRDPDFPPGGHPERNTGTPQVEAHVRPDDPGTPFRPEMASEQARSGVPDKRPEQRAGDGSGGIPDLFPEGDGAPEGNGWRHVPLKPDCSECGRPWHLGHAEDCAELVR